MYDFYEMPTPCQYCGNTGRCEPRTLDSPDGQECDCNTVICKKCFDKEKNEIEEELKDGK